MEGHAALWCNFQAVNEDQRDGAKCRVPLHRSRISKYDPTTAITLRQKSATIHSILSSPPIAGKPQPRARRLAEKMDDTIYLLTHWRGNIVAIRRHADKH